VRSDRQNDNSDPAEHHDERLSACAFVLDQINEAVERMVDADRTEH
jgi:hypothetical protein